MQTTSNILMIRPVAFGYNAETAVNNAFQQASQDGDVNKKAQQEFDDFVNVLRSRGINVWVIDDTTEPHTPDSIFPNNWVSFHQDGTVILYPMFALNRRREKEKNILGKISEKFVIQELSDLSHYEKNEMFLEGTGSFVLDRENKIAYACLSARTHPDVLSEFCRIAGFTPVLFSAKDKNAQDIYHTNVMMCVADRYVVICLDSIASETEQQFVVEKFKTTNKEIINISFDQMNRFAGNMLQVQNKEGEKFLVMSTQAFESLNLAQVKKLESFNHILHAPLYIIEQNGGGSARCMMAEIFLPLKNG